MSLRLPWDPEIESPATIAVIGAGPIGIEAAMYARFLGYFVSIFEAKRVGHRMLDWHQRPLALPAGSITTSLGHSAIRAQNPEYHRIDADRMLTGKEYAEEYLIPLAKSDLLFDDIHFLSPVVDIARIRTSRGDDVGLQERCNDEFRIVVEGRHRGSWIARADCILDCRGTAIEPDGMGPGGGLAIGETECQSDFNLHAPEDRKFDRKQLEGRHLVLVGQSAAACLAAEEWVRHFSVDSGSRLTWVIRPGGSHETERFLQVYESIEAMDLRHVVLLRSLGVDAIERREAGGFRLRLLKDDDSSVELDADVVLRRTESHYRSIAPQLHTHAPGPIRFPMEASHSASIELEQQTPIALPPGADAGFITAEPGVYCLHAGRLEEGAGIGIPSALESIKHLFAVLGGRQDLDLYDILEKQWSNG